MRYMLLIYPGDAPQPQRAGAGDQEAAQRWERLSDDEKGAIAAGYQAINQTAGVTPGEWMGAPETATTVRVEDGRTLVTDGPFVELTEAIGGYIFYEADDRDAA